MSATQNLDYAEEAPPEFTLQESRNRNGSGARPINGAGAKGRPVSLSQVRAADLTAAVNYYGFTLAATALAAVYAVAVMIWGDWDSPQLTIAVCLGFGAAFLWVWKGWFGGLVAFAAFGYALFEYVQWFVVTNQIKVNTGQEVIPEAGRLGNVLYGALWLDPLVLVAVLALLCLSVYFLKRDIKSVRSGNVPSGEGRTEDSHGSVGAAHRASHF